MNIKKKQSLDINNNPLSEGDTVKLLKVSEDLLRGLLESDKEAIKDQVNKTLVVESFDDYNNVELEFTSSDGHIHSIWVEPKDIEKV